MRFIGHLIKHHCQLYLNIEVTCGQRALFPAIRCYRDAKHTTLTTPPSLTHPADLLQEETPAHSTVFFAFGHTLTILLLSVNCTASPDYQRVHPQRASLVTFVPNSSMPFGDFQSDFGVT